MSSPGWPGTSSKKKSQKKRKIDTWKLTLESKNYVDGNLYNY